MSGLVSTIRSAAPEPGHRDLVGDVGELQRQRQVIGERPSIVGTDATRRATIACSAAWRATSSRARPSSCCQQLIRFDTVNPPGNERAGDRAPRRLPARGRVRDPAAGRRRQPPEPRRDARPATTTARRWACLGHVDTVLADPADWTHDPWSGDVADGYLWGRGALDMKSQVAAEAVAAATRPRERLATRPGSAEAAVRLRRGDRRRGGRRVAVRRASRCRPLRHADQRGRRRACSSSTAGAGSASPAPRRASSASTSTRAARPATRRCRATGDNALLKLGAGADRAGRRQPAARPHRGARGAARRRSVETPTTRPPRWTRSAPTHRRCGVDRADVRGHADADDGPRVGQDERDPRPARSCGSTAGCRPGSARRSPAGGSPRCSATTPAGWRSSSSSTCPATPRRSEHRADGRDRRGGSRANEPGASTVPLILPGFSDSSGSATRSRTASPTGSSRCAIRGCSRPTR